MRILFAIILAASLFSNSNAQGCSDAGGCSLGSIKYSDNAGNSSGSFITAGFNSGQGDYNIKYYSFEAGFSFNATEQLRLSAKSGYTLIRGDLADVNGFSDIFLNADYFITNNAAIVLGLKIPLSKADKTTTITAGPVFFTADLPMHYQVSLGTLDVIAGGSFSLGSLFLSAALQYPLNQNANKYQGQFEAPPTNKFERKPDLIARAAYEIVLSNEFTVIPGLLPVIHLGNDKYVDPNGKEDEIEGSSGLTLNFTTHLIYSFSGGQSLELGIGVPLKTRSVRPEGLTRKFAAGIQYKISI